MSDSLPAAPPAGAAVPRRRRRFVVLATAVVVVAAGWSAFWWQASGIARRAVDDALADARAQGLGVTCPGERIAGYPFLLELRCDATSLSPPDGPPLAAGPLVVVARIYAPSRVIAELTGPLTVGAAAGPLATARWSLAHASLRLDDMFGTPRLGLGALAIENLALSAGAAPALAAKSLELHLRPTPGKAGALDVALTAVAAAAPGLPLADLRLLVTVPDGMAMASGRQPLPAEGLSLELTEAGIKAGGADVSAKGSLTLRADGLVDGRLDLTTADPDKLAALLATFLPPGSVLPQAAAGAIRAFGRPVEVAGQKAVTVPVGIVDSRVSIGLVPLGRLPRLDLGAGAMPSG